MATNMRERSDYSDAVAAQVRAERAATGMTQTEVSEKAGMSRVTYLRIERGQRVADTTQLARICGALGITMVELFSRVESDRL